MRRTHPTPIARRRSLRWVPVQRVPVASAAHCRT